MWAPRNQLFSILVIGDLEADLGFISVEAFQSHCIKQKKLCGTNFVSMCLTYYLLTILVYAAPKRMCSWFDSEGRNDESAGDSRNLIYFPIRWRFDRCILCVMSWSFSWYDLGYEPGRTPLISTVTLAWLQMFCEVGSTSREVREDAI